MARAISHEHWSIALVYVRPLPPPPARPTTASELAPKQKPVPFKPFRDALELREVYLHELRSGDQVRRERVWTAGGRSLANRAVRVTNLVREHWRSGL